jgi:hypothetical protein
MSNGECLLAPQPVESEKTKHAKQTPPLHILKPGSNRTGCLRAPLAPRSAPLASFPYKRLSSNSRIFRISVNWSTSGIG